ncbi:MAG TPA: glycoside hydrolase family 30 beta sandwich domain-containing protein [Polyangiaceae bacterium]
MSQARRRARAVSTLAFVTAVFAADRASAQSVAVDTTKRFQTIDGFGTCLSGAEAKESWWQSLYFDELAASIVRMDLTPTFAPPANAQSYCSPWFGQAAPLTLDNGSNGPDGTRTRKYTSADDYSTSFGGCSAPIVVLGPDIDENAKKIDFTNAQAVPGLIAQMGAAKAGALGGFKLYASMWSPAPWVKVSSGNTYAGSNSPLPAAGTPWPFIWGGNFAGGKLDVSGTKLAVFNDGTGPTSALTQFARELAAFLHGFQTTYGVKFYAVSIQNELNFEEFYNSMTYPLASGYVTALKAARAELDAHADTKDIKIIGPEDLMGSDPYAMWQYGSGSSEVDKNLHYLSAIDADPDAKKALGGFNVHGYAADGASSAGANPQSWDWWANGWTTSPAAGIPANVKGFTSFGMPSWMTETSGEKQTWLASSTSGGFPDSGAFSIAIKIQQALTTGQESAWLYWQTTDGSASSDTAVETLTDATQLANAPKLVAAKHFFKYVRPGAVRVQADVTGSTSVLASAFAKDADASLTVVLVNEGTADATVSLALASLPAGLGKFATYTSSSGSLWQAGSVDVASSAVSVTVPAYGILTLTGAGTPPPPSADGGIGGSDGGTGNPSGSSGPGDGTSPAGDDSSGCGCKVEHASSTESRFAVALGFVAIAFGLRRRRRTR